MAQIKYSEIHIQINAPESAVNDGKQELVMSDLVGEIAEEIEQFLKERLAGTKMTVESVEAV